LELDLKLRNVAYSMIKRITGLYGATKRDSLAYFDEPIVFVGRWL
jgi:hypothetical protein